MLERLATGWELAKQSIRVLRLDKELLLFPISSGIACTIVLASFAVPLWFSGALEAAENAPQGLSQNVLTYVVLFAFYFVNYFVIIFFNSALVGCAIIRLKGGDQDAINNINSTMSQFVFGGSLTSLEFNQNVTEEVFAFCDLFPDVRLVRASNAFFLEHELRKNHGPK